MPARSISRYRYITSGMTRVCDKISDYRLVAGNQLSEDVNSCVRVRIPTDLKLVKYDCDPYSTTDDPRTLKELNCDCMVKFNGKWVIQNDLAAYPLYKWFDILNHMGLRIVPKLGYLNADQYKAWSAQIARTNQRRIQLLTSHIKTVIDESDILLPVLASTGKPIDATAFASLVSSMLPADKEAANITEKEIKAAIKNTCRLLTQSASAN